MFLPIYYILVLYIIYMYNNSRPQKPVDKSRKFILVIPMTIQKMKRETSIPTLLHTSMESLPADSEQGCKNPSCFFCTMNVSDPSLRKAKIIQCFKEMPFRDDQELVLALSSLWNIAMAHPNDSEFPSLGVFECMEKLIHRAVSDKKWLLRDQNIYIPYYAAHVIGSYTMNKVQFVEKAIKSGVVSPLMELLRGKITWVEQRVAVRALGHIASHDRTFEELAVHESEIIELTMKIASTCLNDVYDKFISEKESNRLKYHCNLLTRGLGVLEIENGKAEEWASQLQCWSLYLLNCFACRERSLGLICRREFLRKLCKMWGGLANPTSPAGIGLIRTLCKTKTGRQSLADSQEVIEALGNTSRSSDDWQEMAIDCLLLLLKDPETRYKVIDITVMFLGDLVELGSNGGRQELGETITQTLLQDYHKVKYGNLRLKSKDAERALEEIWDLKVDRKKREKLMSEQEIRERKLLVAKMKKEGNLHFWSGDTEKAAMKYTEALDLCPLKMRKERIVLHSNRAQCHLLLKTPELAISDATRALCLSSAASPHSKSLWRRSQAYDMKGLAKESLMDCLLFVKGHAKSEKLKRAAIPDYAARVLNKQMDATWIFAPSRSRMSNKQEDKVQESNDQNEADQMKGLHCMNFIYSSALPVHS